MYISLSRCARFTSNILVNLPKFTPLDTAPADQKATVFLTHVKWISGKRQLEKYFSRFGKVQDVVLFFDAKTGLHKGFASVTFSNADSATAAVQSRPHVIDGDIVGVEFHMPLMSNNAQKFTTM